MTTNPADVGRRIVELLDEVAVDDLEALRILGEAQDLARELRDLPASLPSTGRTIPARRTDPGTSHRATEEIKVRAGSQRYRLLGAFARNVYDHLVTGLTDEQAARVAEGVSLSSEYAKRCSELREGGFIEPTGETRKGAAGQDRIVSRITTKGLAVVRSDDVRTDG